MLNFRNQAVTLRSARTGEFEFNGDFSPVAVARQQSEAYDLLRLVRAKHGPKEDWMEQIISRLLQDFEAGKLTRRQLIRALAVGVTAGPAVLAGAHSRRQPDCR